MLALLWAEVLHGQNFMYHRHNLKMTSEDMKLRSACKVTTPEWCLSGPFKKILFLFSLFIVECVIKTLSIDAFVVYQTYHSMFFVGFFFTLEANITRRCWRRWWFLCKAEVGDLCLLYQPMSYVSTAPGDVCRSERNKSSCRNGSPPDFLCLCGAHAEGRGCECRHQSALCMCLHVLSGGRGAARLCVWRSVCIRVRFDI